MTFEEKENEFRIAVRAFASLYSLKMLDDFFDYWSEPNKKGKMKFELEKTWDTKRRLKRWFNNQKQWHGEKLGTSELRIEALRNW